MKKLLKKIYYVVYGRENNLTIFSWNFIYKRFINKSFYNKELFNNKVIIDYGCGSAPYFNNVKSLCIKYLALDFSNTLVSNDSKISFVKLGDSGEIVGLDEKADVIISNQVIMEVSNLDMYFNEIKKISKTKTKIFLTSPFLQPLGLNDKARYSPYFIQNKLNEIGFDIIEYRASGYFFSGIALSINMLLVMNNEYKVSNDRVKISLLKQVVLTPIILINNIIGLILDKLLPFYRMPANFLIIAEKK